MQIDAVDEGTSRISVDNDGPQQVFVDLAGQWRYKESTEFRRVGVGGVTRVPMYWIQTIGIE